MSSKKTVRIFGAMLLLSVSVLSGKLKLEDNSDWTRTVPFLWNQTVPFSSLYKPYLNFMDNIFQKLEKRSLNISENCHIQTEQLLAYARDGNVEALSFLDATGKPSSGILKGSLSLLGFYSQCLNSEIKNNSLLLPFSGKYCLTTMNFQNESNIFSETSFAVLKRSQKLVIGICVPSECSSKDVELVVHDSSNLISANLNNPIECHKRTNDSLDIAAICILILLLLFTSLAIFATTIDLILQSSSSAQNDLKANSSSNGTNGAYTNDAMVIKLETEDSTKFEGNGSTLKLHNLKPHKSKEKAIMTFLMAFSLKRNIAKICSVDVTSDSITSLHGLRFLSMALIICGHTYSFAMLDLSFRNPDVMSESQNSFSAQFLANGTITVDTFYLISGLLVSLLSLKVMKKKDGKLPLIYFYVHRYIRLTPLFLIVIAFSATLLQYVSTGPNWNFSIQMYGPWCKKNWYLNALYVHNFFDTPNMCLSHTWYLATDMQFYLVTPLIIIPLFKKLLYGVIVLTVFLLATTITTGVLTALNHYPAIPYANNAEPLELINEYYKNIYIKPYCRIGPYLIGIIVGYILWKYPVTTMKKLYTSIGWLLSIVLMLLVLFGMYGANKDHIPADSIAAAYSALARTAWAIALAWFILMCHYGYGGVINSILSFKYFIPFSRLTYSAYLIHPITMAIYYGSTEISVDYSMSFMLYLCIGHFILSYAVSLALSALFESPIIGLERALQKPKTDVNR